MNADQERIARAEADRLAERVRQDSISQAELAGSSDVRAAQADLERQRALDDALFGLASQEAAVRAEVEQRNAAAAQEAARFNASAQAAHQDQMRQFREMQQAAPFELWSMIQEHGGLPGMPGMGGGVDASGVGDVDRSGVLAQLNSGSLYDARLADILGMSESAEDAWSQIPSAFGELDLQVNDPEFRAAQIAGLPSMFQTRSGGSKGKVRIKPNFAGFADGLRSAATQARRPSQDQLQRLIDQYFGRQQQPQQQQLPPPLLALLGLNRRG